MYSLQQRVKIEMSVDLDHDLAIQHELCCGHLLQCFHQLWEITSEWLAGLRLQHNLVIAAKSYTTEAIPLGFVKPLAAFRDGKCGARFHGREGGLYRQLQLGIL